MEKKLNSKEYNSKSQFSEDYDLIFDNCRKYNGAESGKCDSCISFPSHLVYDIWVKITHLHNIIFFILEME